MDRVIIQWTDTAQQGLAKLPKKVRRGILAKANELRDSGNPQEGHKRLTGPLANYFRISYARYRAIYTVQEGRMASGESLIYVKIIFVAVGIRKEGDKKDIYRLAQKLIDMGIVESEDHSESDD